MARNEDGGVIDTTINNKNSSKKTRIEILMVKKRKIIFTKMII